jgi:hypothetical protein
VDERPIFFIHIMKTAGTTFWRTLVLAFGGSEVYPPVTSGEERAGAEKVGNYLDASMLLALDAERLASLRAICGHYPYAVTQLLPIDVARVTILRDPVERTISYLKNAQRHTPRLQGRSLREIYEDGFAFPFWIHNHQTKVFALRPDDLDLTTTPTPVMQPIDIDDDRLQTAMANLATVDVLGFVHRYDEFVTEASRRFGLPPIDVEPQRVSAPVQIDRQFREQIEEDNRYDRELYDWAVALTEERRAEARSNAAARASA